MEKGHSQGFFQFLDLDGHCGLGNFQGFGGTGETEVRSDGVENIKLMEVKLVRDKL